jgi:uncharacterized protein
MLIVAPYNAQVFDLAGRIKNARIGTVDKFQGQQAPVVIYSLTTSSREDVPRGIELLYCLNRMNVATSRGSRLWSSSSAAHASWNRNAAVLAR